MVPCQSHRSTSGEVIFVLVRVFAGAFFWWSMSGMIMALRVLDQFGKRQRNRCFIEAYKNGRENGVVLTLEEKVVFFRRPAVAFSESRSSDALVAYFGVRADFDWFRGNTPSVKAHKNADRLRASSLKEAKQAAQFIWKKLNKVSRP